MEKKKYIICLLAAIVSIIACRKEPVEKLSKEVEMVFTASSADASTKTARQEDGSLKWSPQEEINVFYGNRSQGRFVSTNTSPADVAEFKGTLDMSSAATENGNPLIPYWAVYPYSKDNECDNESVILTHPCNQTSPEGTFGEKTFPSVACSYSLSLPFYNICGGMKISLSRQDITSITLEGNNGESLAGKIKVNFNGDWVPVTTILEGENTITITPGGSTTFVKGCDYYISILPVTFSSGFKMTFRTTDQKIGVLSTSEPVTIKRNVFAVKASIDSYVTKWKDDPTPPTYRSGLYLGINGFNQAVYSYPLTLAMSTNQDQFNNFINTLTSKNGTVLYYAVECSLDALQKASFPPDLANVAVVTFTDGLDQGSMMYNPKYATDEEYLEAINTRLLNEKVSGANLTAYSIGLKGSDVTDITKFRNNLKKLATSDDNAFEVTNMSEVESRFRKIAKVASASTSFAYEISFTIPGQADGTKIRFTFDDVSDAVKSTQYIEGVFNLSTKCLESIRYEGFNDAPATTVKGKADGIFVTYDFKSVSNTDGSELTQSYIKQWACAPSSSAWQVNSEFNKDTDVDVNIDVKRKSAAVMLILDCSSSLGSQFSTMQSSARSFVSTLFEASRDNYSVESVTLSADSLFVREGKTKTLVATISPSTALDKTLIWTSSDPSIATVSADGLVTGRKEGTCIITATAKNGASSQCMIQVKAIQALFAVDLGLSVKWASCNIDADGPEEYGRYFAWGDVVGQTWGGSKWSGSGFSTCPYRELDANNNLKPEYDAAHVLLGGYWRMPTNEEYQELINNCTSTNTNNYNGTGVAGKIFTSKKFGYTDKSIFLPAAGTGDGNGLFSAGSDGFYWSGTSGSSSIAWSLHFGSGLFGMTTTYLNYGSSVRPVSE